MIINKQNTYLCLTKRPQGMVEFLSPKNCFTSPPSDSGIWHGLTICNQQEAEEKIPTFLQVQGKKFLNIEPCLSAITFEIDYDQINLLSQGIDAVILGGETGLGARPINPNWVRTVRDQCKDAGVPFFFKQWGEWAPTSDVGFGDSPRAKTMTFPTGEKVDGIPFAIEMRRVGRKKAGRLLDGRTHDKLPWVK